MHEFSIEGCTYPQRSAVLRYVSINDPQANIKDDLLYHKCILTSYRVHAVIQKNNNCIDQPKSDNK